MSAEWLAGELGKLDLVVVDASWYLPTQSRSGHAEFLAGHIPGAVFFDIDRIVDSASDLPHMLPSAEDFATAAGALGIAAERRIVVYDGTGIFTAPRVWWMLKLFGAKDVSVLDGGYPAWIAGDRPIETGEPTRLATVFAADREPDLCAVADIEAVKAAVESGSAQIVDARGRARFRGVVAEPRPGLRAGHVPESINVPYTDLLEGTHFKRDEALAQAFAEAGVDMGKPVITSCGSGVTAAVVLFGLARLGKDDVRLYDGSWSDWGARADLPAETDDA